MVTEGYLDTIVEQTDSFQELHSSLLPEELHVGAEGFLAHSHPYQAKGYANKTLKFEIEVHNPYPTPQETRLHIDTPTGWEAPADPAPFLLDRIKKVPFEITLPQRPGEYRARIAVDVTIGGRKFGQQAEALITINEGPARSYPTPDRPDELVGMDLEYGRE